jgi:phage gp36-like protein
MMSVPIPPDAFGIASNCNPASVDYFVEVFGYQEAVELSHIDNPTGNTIDVDKIQIALNDAAALINNYIITAPPQGKILIAGSYRRTQAILARWYLDILRPRQQVIDAAQNALQQLELWAAKASPSTGLKWQEAYRYWGSGCTMTKSSYGRGRSFTEPSTSRWVLREGGNNRWWQFPRKEAMGAARYGSEKLRTTASELEGAMPESVLNANELFDSLETTRDLSSFSNTSDAVDPVDGDMVIAINETESEDGEFDNYNGLQEGNTF